jgi:hypothetical protein
MLPLVDCVVTIGDIEYSNLVWKSIYAASTFNTKFRSNLTSNMATRQPSWKTNYGQIEIIVRVLFLQRTEDGVPMPSGNMYLGTLYILKWP